MFNELATAWFRRLGGVTATGASGEFAQSDLGNAGANGAWSAYGGSGTLGSRGGPMATIARGKVFVIGGAVSATDTAFSSVTTNGRDVAFLSNGTLRTGQGGVNDFIVYAGFTRRF